MMACNNNNPNATLVFIVGCHYSICHVVEMGMS